ncbi:alpha-L-rhamnosidase [Kibdelosporangium banguiense]|uniref:alpha-L-rhamnosidase n=1 Tax=Kibdelosporangium banguiense TaxID=1365924 RepID=A0ABS4TYF9_9PSEU|nr:alpha-L-rhamnosidase [Kibdelosporangium banguiense]MBP2328976.1 alpha-L-rhamnosidase [Kibdelosporangium banguiense]
MPASPVVRVRTPTVEHLRDGLGLGTPRPRLSWLIEGDSPNWRQESYEIELERDFSRSTSGQIRSDESVLVPWPFPPLGSREQVRARVRVWGHDETAPTEWSEPLQLETGLLHANDWSALMVSPRATTERLPVFRREFTVRDDLLQARLYVTALGVYEAEINGERVGDDVLAPEWTSYQHRLLYRTHDITTHLRDGPNAIGVMVADGWYRGRMGWTGRREVYGQDLGLLAQLELTYRDDSRETIATGADWSWGLGPVISSDLYDGEDYDARLLRDDWSIASDGPADWAPAEVLPFDHSVLAAPESPPVRRTETIQPVRVIRSPAGRVLLDFGQNLVGRVQLTVAGPAGHRIELRHAEVLEHGELGTRPLRSALARDVYTLRGGDTEHWEPRFTVHGFRYVEIGGWPSKDGVPPVGAVRAVVCHTDMAATGTFTCSDPLLQRLHDNVVWSMRGNFLGIPTDCPQRDERLGWTGDIAAFAPTAGFLYDCAGMLSSWLRDLAADQEPGGKVPIFVPWVDVWHPGRRDVQAEPLMAGWGDAATIVPWTLYQRFGDAGVLERQYSSAVAWTQALLSLDPRDPRSSSHQFGDWLDPTAPPDRPGDGATDPALVLAAYQVRSLDMIAAMANALDRTRDAVKFQQLAKDRRAVFAEFFASDGTAHRESQTSYALALVFDLLAPNQRRTAGDRLARLVLDSGHRIGTGFIGTPIICDALTSTGHLEAAYRLLQQTESPSWLHPVTLGATTVWERWDSMLPDGTINPGEMTSFNHYALGSIADWMHRTVAGLAPSAPGYREVLVAPKPGGTLSSAGATHRTPYGDVSVSWNLEGRLFTLCLKLPIGTTGWVALPDGSAERAVGSGIHVFTCLLEQPEQTREPVPAVQDQTER